MNIPNMLTTFRIILVPIYLLVVFSNLENKFILGGLIFLVAGITDILDGHIARKYDMKTKLGAILDPLADKLMSFAVLISLTYIRLIPKWIIIILGLKEMAMIIGGGILYIFKGNQAIPSNIFGKIATFFFYIATFATILFPKTSISKYLFIITVILNIVAFVNYLIIFISKTDDNGDVSDKSDFTI